MKSKWYLIALLAVLVLVVSACAPAGAPAATGGEEAAPETVGPVTLDVVIGTEPPSLDPSLGSDTTSVWAVRQMFHGLTGFDENAEVVPDLATEWSVSDDGLVWTFKMREDVPWVRLDPATGEFENLGIVNANDVEFAVKRTLDPVEASPYASMLYMIAGSETFNSADPTAADFEELRDAVGVKALDETTVEFTLAKPTGYFPAITGLWNTFPQYAPAVEEFAEKWTEPGNIVTNGPYTLAEWIHGSEMKYVKNPLWPGAEDVQIEVIQGPIIESESTQMSMYEANEVDIMGDPGLGVPLPDMDRIKADPVLSEELFIAPRTCTYYYGFVNAKPPFDDPILRKAFAAAIDRQSLIDNLLKGEQVPAHTFVSPGNFGNAAGNMDIAPWMVMDDYAEQLAMAKEWVAEAGYPEGEGLSVTLMHNTSEAHAQVAQAVQAMWSEAFPNANVSIENQEWQVYLNTLLPDAPLDEKPNVYRLGWCADFPDAANWLNGVFRSNSDQNYAMFNSPEFDALVDEADSIFDQERRAELYSQAEGILIDEATAIAPIYYYTYVRMYKPWLENVVISPVTGDPIHLWKIDMEAKNAARGN